ncbi:hypothetical protein Bca4012_026815 [Brassica carinata]
MGAFTSDAKLARVHFDSSGPTSNRIASTHTTLTVITVRVSDFINTDSATWNEELVRSMVQPADAEVILTMKLSPNAEDDQAAWHYNKNGVYSVKSGYWLSTHSMQHAVITPPPGNLHLKQLIWKLPTAPKVKQFLWKMITSSLPIGCNLQRRHITGAVKCPHCLQDETPDHLFFECIYAQCIWRASGFPNRSVYQPHISMEDRLNVIFNQQSTLSAQLQQLPWWILWRIWKSRNKMIFQQKITHWRTSLQAAYFDAKEWLDEQDYITKDDTTRREEQLHRSRMNAWKRPTTGYIKCNYDGAFSSTNQQAQAGWIIRDVNGSFLGAGQATVHLPQNALESELQAALFALMNCWCKGYTHVILEGDNQNVIKLINKEMVNIEVLNWLRDIWRWGMKFQAIQHVWTNRESNGCADKLAKHTIPFTNSFYFHSVIPQFLHDSMSNDYFDH